MWNAWTHMASTEQSMWAERERSGKRSGAGRKPTWAERSGERDSNNQVERERSGSGRSSERNGAVSGTPVNGAERWAGNFAAPLRSHALARSARLKWESGGVATSRADPSRKNSPDLHKSHQQSPAKVGWRHVHPSLPRDDAPDLLEWQRGPLLTSADAVVVRERFFRTDWMKPLSGLWY